MYAAVLGEVRHQAGRAVQLLRQDDCFAGREDVGVALDVLDVDPGQQLRRRLDLAAHRRRDRRHPLDDAEPLREVRAVRDGGREVHVRERPGQADDALRQLAPQPYRLHPVSAASREPPRQPQLLDQFGREHGLLGDVERRVPAAVHALRHDGPVQPDLGQFERVGVRVVVDRQHFGGDAQRRHRGSPSVPGSLRAVSSPSTVVRGKGWSEGIWRWYSRAPGRRQALGPARREPVNPRRPDVFSPCAATACPVTVSCTRGGGTASSGKGKGRR